MKLFSQVTFSHSLLYYINFSLSCSGFSGDNVGGGYYIFFTLLLENTMHSFTLYTVTGSRILLSSHTVFCPMAIKEQEHCLLLLQLSCLHCPRFTKIESFFFFFPLVPLPCSHRLQQSTNYIKSTCAAILQFNFLGK